MTWSTSYFLLSQRTTVEGKTATVSGLLIRHDVVESTYVSFRFLFELKRVFLFRLTPRCLRIEHCHILANPSHEEVFHLCSDFVENTSRALSLQRS